PYINTHMFFIWISKLLIRKSNITIVTNSALAKKVLGVGGRPFVLPDVLPTVTPKPLIPAPSNDQKWKILLVSTYAKDEPYTEVFAAFEILGQNFSLEVTGKIPKHLDATALPENVSLLGYVSHTDYWRKLESSHFIVDLT